MHDTPDDFENREEHNEQEAVREFVELREFLEEVSSKGIRALPLVKERIENFSAKYCDYRVRFVPGFRNEYAAKDGSWKIYLSKIEEQPHFYLEVALPEEWKETDDARVEGMREEKYKLLRLQFGGKIGLDELGRWESIEFTLTEETIFVLNREHGGCYIRLPKGTRIRKESQYLPGSRLDLKAPKLGIHFSMPEDLFPKEGCPAENIVIGK